MTSPPALRSSDPVAAAEAFEQIILRALRLDPASLDVRGVAARYRMLSKGWTEERTPGPSAPEDPLGLAAFGLIFAMRTFHLSRRIIELWPPPKGRLVEFGAGWGPFALSAALTGRPTSVVDAVASMFSRATILFEAAKTTVPSRTTEGAVAWAAPFVLNEMATSVPEATRVVRRWMDALPPEGRLYILEPGLKETSQVLQGVRDALGREATFVAPCPHQTACPLLAAQDWCHLTWPTPLGPLGRRVADLAKRHHGSTHFSLLVLDKRPPRPSREGARVLEIKASGPQKVWVRVCSSQGSVIQLTALKRDKEAFAALWDLKPGQGVRIEASKTVHKGDGLRISDPSALVALPEETE